MNDNISKLYGALKSKGYTDIGKDEDAFRDWIGKEGNVKILYGALSKNGYDDIGDEAQFTEWVGVKPPQDMTNQETSSYQPTPEEVQQYTLQNKPDIFKPKTGSLVDRAAGIEAQEQPTFEVPNVLRGITTKETVEDLNNTVANAYSTANQMGERMNARVDMLSKNIQDPEYLKSRNELELRVLASEIDGLLDKEHGRLKSKAPIGQNAFNAIMGSRQYNQSNKSTQKNISNLDSAKRLIEQSQYIVDAAKRGDTGILSDTWQGFKDSLEAEDFTFGLADAASSAAILDAIKKVEKGETLTEAEDKLLRASAINMATQYYYANDLSRAYNAGQFSAESVPFMLEMAINPISSFGKASAKTLLNYGLKSFAKQVVKGLGKGIVSGTGMALTTGLGRVASGTTDRLSQGYNYGVDFDGNLFAEKKKDAMGVGEAFARSLASTAIENQSEMIFNAFKGMGGFMKGVEKVLPGGVNKFFDMLSHNKVADAYRWLKNSPVFRNYLVKDVRNATQIGGIFEEYAEEVYNNLANFAIGEMSWEDVVSLDKNIDTFLGLAPTQVMFGILGLGGAASMRYQTRKTLEDLKATMNEQQRKELEGLLDMGIDAKEVDVRGFIRGVMENQKYTIENKRDLIKAAYYVAQQRSIDELTEADVIDKVNAENQFIDSMTDPSTGNYAELSRNVINPQTGESEQQKGYVVGWIGEGEKRQPIFVADGMDNNYANRVVLKPTEWSMDSYREMPAEQVKAVNEEMNREEAAAQAERESKYATKVLNYVPMNGDQVIGADGQVLTITGVTPDGIVYENGEGKVEQMPLDNWKDLMQAQLEAQEATATPTSPMSTPMSEEVQPVAEGSATEQQVVQPQAPIIPTKEDGSIDFVSYGKEGTFKTLGEKYGEKMPNKVAITAKALAEDVKKAQKKLNKAEEAYDNAPIGREQKAEEVRDKAKSELEAIQREANFWAEMDAEIKEAQAVRESMLNPQAEVNTSSEPLTADEFVAQQLASGNIVLNKEDYKRETGYGDEEVEAMNGGSKKLLADNGMTIQEAGERLMEMDRENGTNFFDQSDPNAGRDELLSVLGSVKTRKELNQYVASNRAEQAKRDSEGLYNELERQVMDAHYASLEDYVLQMEASEMENPFRDIDVAQIDVIFAEVEEEYQNYINNEQGTTSEIAEGSDNVLSEEQADNTGGTSGVESEGDSERNGERTSEESERAYAATEELKQEEGETTLQFAERAAEENDRREPLRNRAREWAVKLGVTVNLIESVHDVYNLDALAAIQSGQRVTGWFEESTGEVCFYMPFLESESDVDATFIHEVVAHKGLRGLLGEKFDAFCDEVWDVMSDADRVKYQNYPGVSHLEGKEKSRAAADEYIAHLAENVDVTESAWSKLTELIKRFLKALGLEPKMTNADIANTIKRSYQRLLEGEVSVESVGNGTRFNAKRTSDRRQDMNRINNTVDQALSLVTGKDVKDIKAERVKKAQKRKEDAAEIYQSVLSGDFNDVTLQKINDYIDDATPLHPYGQRISQRLPQKLERGLHEGARTNAVDALFSRICESAVPASRRASEAGRREIEERKKEALKGWAIATNNWHTDLSDFADEEDFIRQGTDSKVYLAKDGKHVIKVSFGKPEGKRFRPDIDTIALFNSVFRNTAYEIVGYGEFDGKFARILKQPFVDFADKTALNADEREEYMRTLGFEPINDSRTAFSNGSIVAADLQKSNILKDAAGNISVIDADMKLHTKDVGGSYTYPPVEADLPEGKISFRISNEEKSIIDKAKADGTYMKAPNGEPTNLTEKQWAQVRTEAFKKWFGDWVNDPANASKVVDENGEPLVMIHNSTTSGITEFRPNVGNAIFFADKIAQDYVSGFERGENDYEVFLNIKNPYTESYEAAFIDETDGVDGVFVTAEVDEGIGHAAIVRNPNQIKSATDNVGAFDGGNNDIRFRVTPEHKQHQMDIINETNPAPDSNYTWIRSVDDIKSFEEALDDSDYADYKGEDFDPSYTWAMAEKALRDGKVIVYSSYPIKNGVFVTPSYMEAQSYGGTTPYMAKVNLEDVAWIDPTQGQLATDSKVKSKKAASGVRFRMTNAEKEALRDSEESKALFDYAKKRFGRTFDLREAGYVLPDGSMLDFSGRHEMSPGSDTSFLRGDRSVDHRGIVDVAYDFEGEETGFKTDMADFLNRGAIRIDGSTGAIDLTMKPTSKQKDILRRLVQRMDGDVWIDFSEGWDSEHYVEYAGVKPMRVISDIDKYYDEGIKPEGNTRFRFIGERGARNLDKAEEATTRIDNLAIAREMESAEKDDKTIKMATGWERGADGLWRYEVDDNIDFELRRPKKVELKKAYDEANEKYYKLEMRVPVRTPKNATEEERQRIKDMRKELAKLRKAMNKAFDAYYDYSAESATLGEFLGKDNQLFKEYPELADYDVSFLRDSKKLAEGLKGSFTPEYKVIWVDDARPKGDIKSTLVHEIQHAIQGIEGFAQGGTPAAFASAKYQAEEWKANFNKFINRYGFEDWSKNLPTEDWMKYGKEYKGQFGGLHRAFIDNAVEDEDVKKTLTKELDYVKSAYDKFYQIAGGMDPAYKFKDANEWYRSLSGEVESRNVQQRMGMTDEQRRSTLASETEDVAREDQIFLQNAMEEGQTMFRVVKDPAVDYISQAEDVVEVPRDEVMYTVNNIANQLYKVSGRFMRELYKYGTIGRVLKGEYAEIDQIKAKKEYDHAKPIFDEYLNELVWMKYQSTEAAQEVINDVISDVEYAMQYYKDLALGKDVWRTKNGPRFRISEKHRKDVSKAIADFTSSYNSKPVSYITNDMTDEQVDDLLEGYLDSEDVQRMKNEGAHGFYLRKTDRIYIFVDDIPLESVENSMFHENLHLLLGVNNPLTSVLWDKVKDKPNKFIEVLKNSYRSDEWAEEYFVYHMAKGLSEGELEKFISNFAEADKEALFNILNTLGYEYESESRERLGQRRRIRATSNSLQQGGKSGERRSGESREALARKAGERKERLQQLFGRVADMGLDGVLGNKEYVNAMVDMYKVLPEAVQREVADEALSRYGGDVAPAVSDWLNHKAEASVWDKVVAVIREALRKVGFDLDLNTNEAKYILWRSQKPLNRNNLLEVAEDIDMKYRLKVGEYSTNDDGTTPDGGGTKFRVSGKLNVRDEYEATIKKGGFQAREAVQDAMLSLRKFQELIEKVSGKKVRDFENAWMHENRLSSVVQAQIHEMERKFYKPMMDAIKKLMAVASFEQEQVADYLMLKHGIERNREMAVRKALTDSEGKIDRIRLEQWYQDKRNVRSSAATPHLDTWRKQQEELDNIALMYGADMSRDYSGLTSMFGTDDLADSTQQAYDEVEALETAHPAETEALGKAIKAMTQNTLDESFGSGLMDRKVYDELSKDMYDYYIPLRGFDETTSEEVYAYLDQDRGAFNAPLKRAKGRSSKSDNPIAYLKSIAESCIMQGERNKMKQSFLNLVINNPSDLVSVREGVWVIYNPASGEWEAAAPPAIPNNATPADVEAAMEAWEANMESLAASDPNVKKVSEAQDIPYRVVGNRMNQHQVIVKRLGKSYTLTINGNPRLAMALNGLTNPNNKSNDGKVAAYVSSKIDTLNRTLSAWYTTRNPDFVASNFMRDTFYTNAIVRAKEGNAYANKFHKNYGKVLPQMLILFSKYEKGTLNPADKTEAAFLDFMMNGGETGYSNLKDLEHIKKQIAKELKGNRFAKVEALAEKFDILNRAVENTARFAAFLTSREEGRSIAKSVFDAKEISVNFNKKGAGGTFFGMTGQTGFGNLAAMVGAGGRALYVFFNAAVQGTTNLMHVMKVNPKGTSAGLAAMFLMGAVVPFLFGGDDDDEKDYYDLPEHVRRNHLIIPGTGDAWISIPLPIEYRIMYGMGELLSSWRTGHERGSDIARKMLNLTGQALPLNFLEEGLDAFVPSAISPIWQVYNNRSWTGLPIYKDNEFNKDDPEYTKAFKNTDRGLVKFTKALYEWTFDEENQEDGINLNPAVIETLAKGYFGGLATQLSNIMKVGGMIAGEQEFDWRNIPIGNRILKTGDERTKGKRVTNEYFENMEKLDFLQSRERMLKKAEKGVAVPEADKFNAQKDLETMQGTEVYKKYQEFKKQKKVVDKIRKTIKEKGSTPELEKKLMDAQEAANKAVR